jgi:hypothetical protein
MRIVLWIIGICVSGSVGALALFVAWVCFANNRRPPEEFAQQFSEGRIVDNIDTREAIAEVLRAKYPPGTFVRDLKETLYKEGFRDTRPPQFACVSEAEADERHLLPPYNVCPIWQDQMEYHWAIGLVCGGSIFVRWTRDGSSRIVNVQGSGRTTCL